MRGATILKASDDKTRELNKHTLMAFSGEAGDTSTFAVSSSLPSNLADVYVSSSIRRIHPSKRSTLLHA